MFETIKTRIIEAYKPENKPQIEHPFMEILHSIRSAYYQSEITFMQYKELFNLLDSEDDKLYQHQH